MNHELLKTIIYEEHEIIRNSVIYPRRYSLQDNVNYILVGLRRSGKSTLLYKKALDLVESGVSWEQIIFINFEDERLSEFTYLDFDDIIKVKNELSSNKAYYFFDEIQNIDLWDKFARRLADSNERVYITGSNSKMLSTEMNASLGGRFIAKEIMPYSFQEYLNVIGYESSPTAKSQAELSNHASEYLINGGLPASVFLTDKKEYINSVYQKLLLNDVILHNRVRNENAIKILVKKIAESIKDELSFTKLYNILKSIGFDLSKQTTIDYVSYVIKSNLIFSINNYYASFVDKESIPKYYFSDNGILNLFLFDKNTRLLENSVAIFFKRMEIDFYYLKSSKTGLDIDFYVPDANLLVQVCYSLSDYDTLQRELNNFSKWHDNSSTCVIVTMFETNNIEHCGKDIKIIPLSKFLRTDLNNLI